MTNSQIPINIKAVHAQALSALFRYLVALLVLMFPLFTFAAQLVMVEEQHCPYCERFNAEIAPIYPKTAEGKLAPLRRIDIADGWPEDLSNIKSETLTPTFILIEDNKEIGRLYGYQGDEFFWFLLGQLFEKLESS